MLHSKLLKWAIFTLGCLLAFGDVVPAARADVITTYTFAPGATTHDGGEITGSFQMDRTLYVDNTTFGYVAGSSTIKITV